MNQIILNVFQPEIILKLSNTHACFKNWRLCTVITGLCSSTAHWPLTFVLGQLRNLGYFIKRVCGTAWISQSQTTELSSIKLGAQL